MTSFYLELLIFICKDLDVVAVCVLSESAESGIGLLAPVTDKLVSKLYIDCTMRSVQMVRVKLVRNININIFRAFDQHP